MPEANLSGLLRFALESHENAAAILGQAILDEGGIGASGISIFYTSESEALHLWEIADSLGYANPYRKKKHRDHYHYGFSIKATKIGELYETIGPLPNAVKDRVFRHLAHRRQNAMRKRGETKQMMLRLLEQKPMTVLQLMLELNISASTARKHLKALSIQGKVKTCRNYEEAFERSRRTAHIWEVT